MMELDVIFLSEVKRYCETRRFRKKLSELILEMESGDREILANFADFSSGEVREDDLVKLSDAFIKWSSAVI